MKTVLLMFVSSADLSGSADMMFKPIADYDSAQEVADYIHGIYPRRKIELKVYVTTPNVGLTGHRDSVEFYSADGTKRTRPSSEYGVLDYAEKIRK